MALSFFLLLLFFLFYKVEPTSNDEVEVPPEDADVLPRIGTGMYVKRWWIMHFVHPCTQQLYLGGSIELSINSENPGL